MPTVEFYYMPESPPCRAVQMVANLVGVTLNKHYINLFTKEHLQEAYLKMNPMHKVPFIVDGDVKINESRAIMQYLVNKYLPDDNGLYPRDADKRAQIDEMLYIDMGTIYQSASKLFAPRLFGKAKEFDPESEKAFKDSLDLLDSRLSNNGGKKFLFGDHLTIADVSLVASLSFPDACGYDFSEHKHLSAYIKRLKETMRKKRRVGWAGERAFIYTEGENRACVMKP